MQSFGNLGFRLLGDPITGHKQGVFQNPLSIHPDKGNRTSSASDYYTGSVSHRPNLHPVTESTVDKIIFKELPDGQVTATGVDLINKNGNKSFFQANKEVILHVARSSAH